MINVKNMLTNVKNCGIILSWKGEVPETKSLEENTMKNEKIKKINTLGKVSRILLIIMRVACIIGIVACLVSSVIVLTSVSDDSFSLNGTASMQMTVDEGTNFFVTKNFIKIGGVKISNIEKLDDEHISGEFFGTKYNMNVNCKEKGEKNVYDITADLDAVDGRSLKMTVVLACLGGALACALALISVIFAGSLAKALEKCESPFEAGVSKAMKNFGISLIPMALMYLCADGVNMTMALLVIAIIIFSYIFSYGAQLQQESDETL